MPGQPAFQFDQRFQLALLKLIVDEDAFASMAVKFLKATYFENPSHRWIFDVVERHWERYGHSPTTVVLYEYLRQLDPLIAAQYQPTVVALEYHGRVDAQFVGDRVVDFVKRNMFVEGFEQAKRLYNAGQVEEAYDFWQTRGEEVRAVSVGEIDRSFFFEDFEQRQKRRAAATASVHLHTFSTGIPDLDDVLNGGLSLGEMGLWMAPEKKGKSFLLTWHAFYAVRALRIPVVDYVLEGGRSLHEDRFDAAFSNSLTNLIKRGELSNESHRILTEEYRSLRSLLVVRAFTKGNDAWITTVADIYADIQDLIRMGFRPKMVVVDYGDLLRHPGAETEVQHQTESFKGLRKLCDRDQGYALWTAAQLQRVPPASERNENFLHRGQSVADAIGKVRIPEFYGSINATLEEQRNNRARLFAEQYRHGAAQRVIHVETDFSHGRFLRSVLSTSAPEDAPETQGHFF